MTIRTRFTAAAAALLAATVVIAVNTSVPAGTAPRTAPIILSQEEFTAISSGANDPKVALTTAGPIRTDLTAHP